MAGIVVAVADPDAVSQRWATVAGGSVPGCNFVDHERSPGLVEIQLELGDTRQTILLDGR
jgi:hypothetical protein